MTVVISSRVLKWTLVLVFAMFVGSLVLPKPQELVRDFQIQLLIEEQNKICGMLEAELEASIHQLYGVPQDLILPKSVQENFRLRYASSKAFTEEGARSLDDAILACTVRTKWQSLVDRISEGAFPHRYQSAD